MFSSVFYIALYVSTCSGNETFMQLLCFQLEVFLAVPKAASLKADSLLCAAPEMAVKSDAQVNIWYIYMHAVQTRPSHLIMVSNRIMTKNV